MVGAKRWALILVAVLAVAGGAAALWTGVFSAGHVYSVAAIDAGLAHQPDAWLGRTLRVRGRPVSLPIAEGCSARLNTCLTYVLEDTSAGSGHITDLPPPADGSPSDVARQGSFSLTLGSANLIVYPGDQDSLLQALRSVPLLGSLVPGPRRLDTPGVFRLRLQRAPADSLLCSTPPCYEAIILDAAAPS